MDKKNTKNELSNDGINDKKGVVFNIQRYSIHDGPGIRTTVFLKGCPLSCLWCQNPESQSMKPEIFYNAERCVGCGKCITVCTAKAIEMGDAKAITDRMFILIPRAATGTKGVASIFSKSTWMARIWRS